MSLVSDTIETISKAVQLSEDAKKKIYFTSSFQTQSLPLLHIISNRFNNIPVLFIDTGFLFPETYSFVNKLQKSFNLTVISLKSELTYVQQKENGMFLYAKDTSICCNVNKVVPLKNFLSSGDFWISGVRRDQTSVRNEMKQIETDSDGIVRVHPMLNWTSRDVYQYIAKHNLEKHPLEKEGYLSVGCVPCTQKWGGSDYNRNGRWVGSKKTECGLHLKSD